MSHLPIYKRTQVWLERNGLYWQVKLYRIFEFGKTNNCCCFCSRAVFIHRWSIFRGYLYSILMADSEAVFVDRWSLFTCGLLTQVGLFVRKGFQSQMNSKSITVISNLFQKSWNISRNSKNFDIYLKFALLNYFALDIIYMLLRKLVDIKVYSRSLLFITTELF